MKTNLVAFLAVFSLLLSCGSKDDDNGGSGGNPAASLLVAPLNNSECISGVDISASQSSVSFEWNATENTQTYFLYVKNLVTNQELQYNAGTALMYDVTLVKGVPYSWYVSSKSPSGATASSDKWKFYNAGDGVENYAPFPAEALYPAMSSTVTGSPVVLQWSADDLDSDIHDYKIYMDTTTNPSTLLGTVTATTLNTAVSANTTYYWKVITTDGAGNSSTSPVFQFKVD
jgi:hypothetical protein